ncbi:MAG: protein kinase family protein [Deltaproteobacteria bacterium]|nr:protein kinase family protein [Deltaproteobacteria bacterium]
MSRGFSQKQIEKMAARWMPKDWRGGTLRVHTDTTNFFDIGYGDVVLLDGRPYLIRNSAREGRFGLDDDVKHWVKRSIDLTRAQMCIVKLVFYEKFFASIAGIKFECFRSPKKEARILHLVKDHPNFMHGISALDDKGNLVRVLEYITGKPLSSHVADIRQNHKEYFHKTLPHILEHFIGCLEAIQFLHEHGEKHGDIRRDHILIDSQTGLYRWIDFDFNYRHRENIYGYDLFGIGNVLAYVVGKGDVTLHDLKNRDSTMLSRLNHEDLNIVFHNRVANLKKIYPYIPNSLNEILLHFSTGANWFYEQVDQLIHDLHVAMADIH